MFVVKFLPHLRLLTNAEAKANIKRRILYIEGKSVAETAKEMRLTISTIKSHKRNGLMLLRTMITRMLVILF